MKIISVETPPIVNDGTTIFQVLENALPIIEEGSIVAVTSKIVSICEGRIVPVEEIDKKELVIQQSDLYLPDTLSNYGFQFTVTNNTLIPMAGIDESNGEGYYILWPKDPQASANQIRKYLKELHSLQNVGVVITDSTCQPLRRGTTGISLAHSGFLALRNYIGEPDIFGRPLGVTQANIAGGLAAASVLAMGEGAEQTPLCVMTDLTTIVFQDHDPTQDELAETRISLQEDLFAPILAAVDWSKGKRSN
ncbi:MAG: coenzyme F420-0:L-glutamate ligase [Patescibacteria group bacterium]|nr:coenzyme F420-0:L-glutamate ligase [Patescibacteria group bacterium]